MANAKKQMMLRMSQSQYDKVKHFANQRDLSVNQFLLEAIDHYTNWIVSDYDVPTAYNQRLNQLIVAINKNTDSLVNLKNIVNPKLDAMLNITRGPGYDEEGDVNE